MSLKRIAFFASGNGTNAENLIERIQAGDIKADAAIVICDNPEAGVIKRAGELGVETIIVDRKKFPKKNDFEQAIITELKAHKIDLIVLAGFMRILSSDFVTRYSKKIINIHPSYLPAFRGAHAIRDAFEAKVKETGVTVHYVEPEVDAGPVILQQKLIIKPDDTLESLEARIHALEYEIYPKALKLVLSGRAPL